MALSRSIWLTMYIKITFQSEVSQRSCLPLHEFDNRVIFFKLIVATKAGHSDTDNSNMT